MATFLSKEHAKVDTVWQQSLITQVEVKKISHAPLHMDVGKSLSKEIKLISEREPQKSTGITETFYEESAMLWENDQKPYEHQIKYESFKSSECAIDDCLHQSDLIRVNKASSGPVSCPFQTCTTVNNYDDSLSFLSDKARSTEQVQEITHPLLKDETGKGKCYSKSTMYNDIQTGVDSIPRKDLHHRKFVFFQRKSSGSCSEAYNKLSGDRKCVPSDACIASPIKAACESENYAMDTRCDTDSDSEKEITGYCFHFKITSCLKIPHKKPRGNKQVLEEELVKESKVTASTGWRQVLSGVVNDRDEGNIQTQILRAIPETEEPTLHEKVVFRVDKSKRLHGTHGVVQSKCSPRGQEDLNIKDSMILQENQDSATMNENVMQAQTARTKTSKEGTVKTRKYQKMKPWRTVSYLSTSEANVPNPEPIKVGSDTPNHNAVKTHEYCNELEGGGKASRPYSKLSFFKKIRRYNQLRKTAGGLNANHLYAFESASTREMAENTKASESLISHVEVSSTQTADLLGGQKHVLGTEIIGSIVSQEDATKLVSTKLSKAVTASQVESYMASEDVNAKIHKVAQENTNAAEMAQVISQEHIAEAVECSLGSKCNVTAPAGKIAFLENDRVEEFQGDVVSQENGFAVKRAHPLKHQEYALATRVVATTVSQKNIAGEGSKVLQDDIIVAIPIVSQEDVAPANELSPITFQECFTTRELSDTISNEIAGFFCEVDAVTGVTLCNENLDGIQPNSAEEHVTTIEQSKTLPNKSFTRDLKHNFVTTMQEAERIHNSVCSNTEHERNDQIVPEVSKLATFKITPEIKCSLAISTDSGNFDKLKQLANSPNKQRKWDLQRESFVEETLSIEPCGESAPQNWVDKNEGFLENLQGQQNLEINNLTQEVLNGNTTQRLFSLAHCSEFLEHDVLRNKKGWDVRLPSRMCPSSQEITDTNLSEAFECDETKEAATGISHISVSSNQKGLSKNKRWQGEYKNEKGVVRGIRSYSCPDSGFEMKKTYNPSPPSLINSPDHQTLQADDDTLTGTAFWSEAIDRNLKWIGISANVKPMLFDTINEESDSKCFKVTHKTDRWTTMTLNEMNSTIVTQEKENCMLYEAAVATVQTAIQAATSHIALWQQEHGWDIKASSSQSDADSSCVNNPMTIGKSRLPDECTEPE